MPASTDFVSRTREVSREVLHDGLARLRKESPPQVAQRVGQLDRWLREQEKAADRRRKNLERWLATQTDDLRARVENASDELRTRLENASDDVRARIAQGIRELERRVRPA